MSRRERSEAAPGRCTRSWPTRDPCSAASLHARHWDSLRVHRQGAGVDRRGAAAARVRQGGNHGGGRAVPRYAPKRAHGLPPYRARLERGGWPRRHVSEAWTEAARRRAAPVCRVNAARLAWRKFLRRIEDGIEPNPGPGQPTEAPPQEGAAAAPVSRPLGRPRRAAAERTNAAIGESLRAEARGESSGQGGARSDGRGRKGGGGTRAGQAGEGDGHTGRRATVRTATVMHMVGCTFGHRSLNTVTRTGRGRAAEGVCVWEMWTEVCAERPGRGQL